MTSLQTRDYDVISSSSSSLKKHFKLFLNKHNTSIIIMYLYSTISQINTAKINVYHHYQI
ncbi:hypothetical protein DERF_014198 [Dermatophagoides farinae]|uniref:Uncharacterized protein n=1 Tax=Dermatophagoides farinae TaxID=6954 RepID=A0A922KYR5_DERFA|nr:hypothetical protein DERF_014198 [Dermatophagoides farinae]